jgi:putative membrane protein
VKTLNAFLATLVYVIVSVIVVLIGLVLFGWATTKYKDWEEIEKGNTAVALSVGGKIVGLSIIMLFAILEGDHVTIVMLWGGLGVILQLIIYYLFDFLTPKFSVQEKLKEGNIAVGIISLCVSIGLGFVIGASIT